MKAQSSPSSSSSSSSEDEKNTKKKRYAMTEEATLPALFMSSVVVVNLTGEHLVWLFHVLVIKDFGFLIF